MLKRIIKLDEYQSYFLAGIVFVFKKTEKFSNGYQCVYVCMWIVFGVNSFLGFSEWFGCSGFEKPRRRAIRTRGRLWRPFVGSPKPNRMYHRTWRCQSERTAWGKQFYLIVNSIPYQIKTCTTKTLRGVFTVRIKDAVIVRINYFLSFHLKTSSLIWCGWAKWLACELIFKIT